MKAGRVVKVPEVVASQVHTSRFGVIPKDQRSDKWRLIVDLSSLAIRSVNDGISQALCSMHYATFDEAVQKVVASGPGARLAKIDVEQAYRNIPVHPEDRHLLGMAWEGEVCRCTAAIWVEIDSNDFLGNSGCLGMDSPR